MLSKAESEREQVVKDDGCSDNNESDPAAKLWKEGKKSECANDAAEL
jgi:hypothetical protein